MRMISAYRVPDYDDKGCAENNNFLLVNSVGYYEFDEAYGSTHRKRGRKDYYLSYNHSGLMKLRMGSMDYQVEGGTVFIYKPFEEQYYGQADKKDPISNYWVHFTGYGIYELLVNAKLSEGSLFHTGINDEFPAIFEHMIKEVLEKRSGYELLSSSLLIQLLSVISRKLSINNGNLYNERDIRINETINFIHRNYSKKITVSGLAAMANLSASGYLSVFKQFTGVSPQQYIINFRLQKARELMSHTNLNLQQISSLVGFNDQLYFSRLFKKYEKSTPSNYKAKINSYR